MTTCSTSSITPTWERSGIWPICMRGRVVHATIPSAWYTAGSDGLAINFVDYLKELPYFAAEVLPRLERLGLRTRSDGGE